MPVLKEYDKFSNICHYQLKSTEKQLEVYEFEWWKEYDNNGNVIYYKDTQGCEIIRDGNIIMEFKNGKAISKTIKDEKNRTVSWIGHNMTCNYIYLEDV